MSDIRRCPWAGASLAGDTTDTLMRDYHDTQWGKPCHGERELFEMLILEGAQAGLSWSCILHKRENYRAAFDNWDVEKIASYDENKIAELLQNPGIVRNRLKVGAAVTNAQAVLQLPNGLDKFLWDYVDTPPGTGGKPIINRWERQEEMSATSPLSDEISKDMKKLGFKFVGSTIVYSYLQSVGIINDHMAWCDFR
ncbi:MAG: DNA-3-methyladenine glycosylase I [Oscillospiraceae bacterium]|jgi:DNA-3-methyladenine glycosylase I|nr:DNA-3-methyladenine glycosylase I [Oscillospiraceae bacterium]